MGELWDPRASHISYKEIYLKQNLTDEIKGDRSVCDPQGHTLEWFVVII